MIDFTVNGKSVSVDADPEMPLLWVLRDSLGLTGTKYGCGIAQCGACTVLIDGEAVRSCTLPAQQVGGREVVTIEGLSPDRSHVLQKAWIAEQVPQCGYCQSGQILQAVSLLSKNSKPSDDEIDEAMAGVLCRCGTYLRIRAAIKRAAADV